MSSFEPILVIYGSPKLISNAKLRLPVSSLFAFDVESLEDIVNLNQQLSDPCLNRYFIILLQSINKDLLTNLQSNYRIISIYNNQIISNQNINQLNRMINSFKQLTLDVSNDILRFLTSEGEKQMKLERMNLVIIYYQQARILKEWIMAFFKVRFSHFTSISIFHCIRRLNHLIFFSFL
jgi:hypothetical protein